LEKDIGSVVDEIIRSRGRSPGAIRELVGALEYELEAADQHLPADSDAREYVDGARRVLAGLRRIA